MNAPGAVAVESARSEVVPSPGAGKEARLAHSHAGRSRHRRVGLLYLGRILRIVGERLTAAVVIKLVVRKVALCGDTTYVWRFSRARSYYT